MLLAKKLKKLKNKAPCTETSHNPVLLSFQPSVWTDWKFLLRSFASHWRLPTKTTPTLTLRTSWDDSCSATLAKPRAKIDSTRRLMTWTRLAILPAGRCMTWNGRPPRVVEAIFSNRRNCSEHVKFCHYNGSYLKSWPFDYKAKILPFWCLGQRWKLDLFWWAIFFFKLNALVQFCLWL